MEYIQKCGAKNIKNDESMREMWWGVDEGEVVCNNDFTETGYKNSAGEMKYA